MQVEFGGETLTSDLVQGCYTEGLEKNNTLHWTLNLAVTSCSAPLTLSNTMPQFGKEGTFGEGSAAGTGYAPLNLLHLSVLGGRRQSGGR